MLRQGIRAIVDADNRGWRGTISWKLLGANLARMAILVVTLAVYSWFRKTYFQQPAEAAYQNALDLIELQRRLGIAVTRVEIPLQQWVLDRGSLIDFFNVYYRQMKPAVYLSALLCLLLAPVAFRRIWRIFMIATLLAVPWYAIYPLAPPRLMGQYGFAFVDTLAVYGGTVSSTTGVGGANQFAAMPSMHICWSTIAALWLAAALPWRRVGLCIGIAHVAIMCLTVIVTGNHYVLDIVGGWCIAGAAIGLERLLAAKWPAVRRRVGGWSEAGRVTSG